MTNINPLLLQADQGRMMFVIRVGQGYDVHRLVEGRKLILGGVEIPFEKGLYGHSDADVLLHAVSDALLGASAMGDIGKIFPDTNPVYKDADSKQLLEKVREIVSQKGYKIINIDATIIAQEPKVQPFVLKMRENISNACGLDADSVSVKATTEEGLGFSGRGEGIAATAICLIESK